MDTFQTFLNACRNGQKNIVKILLERGDIDLNRRDAEGNTALHYVCREGYRDLVVLLLEKGADASSANNRGETPLHAAARKGNREILAKLIDAGADPDAADNEGCTPLMRLVENRRTDAALWLIDRGADTEATDQTGHRALDYATAHGLTEVVARLTQNDAADGMARDTEGNTPLHQAVYNDQAEVVRTLLAASKAQLDAPNDAGAPRRRSRRKPAVNQRDNAAALGGTGGQSLPREETARGWSVDRCPQRGGRDAPARGVTCRERRSRAPACGASCRSQCGGQPPAHGTLLCRRTRLHGDRRTAAHGRRRRIKWIENLKTYRTWQTRR